MLIPFVLLLIAAPLLAQQTVRYEISFPNAVHHEAQIRATFSGVNTPTLDIVMSTSSPGRYALHEFAKNIYSVRVSDGEGRELKPVHLNLSTWRIDRTDGTYVGVAGHNGSINFEYTLFGDRTDGTYVAIDETHAHLNLPATFVWARGFEKAPVAVHFNVPDGAGWRVATQLIAEKDGTWTAPNLDRLMDSPTELSEHHVSQWKVEDAQFGVALHSQATTEQAEKYGRMCQAVVLEEEGVFGAFPEYDGGAYTFLVDYLPYASFDGMEHRNSTVITGSGTLLRESGSGGAIGAAAHEFFHSWNVKRIRPKALEPFNFEDANVSGELWFAEGFTNYYGPLALERAGLSSLDEFVNGMGRAVNAVLTSPGRKIHSAVEMSELAPFVDAATSIDQRNFANTFISYYTYGQALAFGIDLSIRERFPGKSLDDWMKTMWRQHPDANRPYTLQDLERALADVTGDAAFAKQVFEQNIAGKEPLPYESLVSTAGLVLREAHAGKPWLGRSQLSFTDTGATIDSETSTESPLYNAGLDRGDRILEFAGREVKANASLETLLDGHKPGDRIRLRVRTRRGDREADLILGEDPQLEIVTFEKAGRALTSAITNFRQAWLGSKALHPLPKIASVE